MAVNSGQEEHAAGRRPYEGGTALEEITLSGHHTPGLAAPPNTLAGPRPFHRPTVEDGMLQACIHQGSRAQRLLQPLALPSSLDQRRFVQFSGASSYVLRSTRAARSRCGAARQGVLPCGGLADIVIPRRHGGLSRG
jgi:hypothetical protein